MGLPIVQMLVNLEIMWSGWLQDKGWIILRMAPKHILQVH